MQNHIIFFSGGKSSFSVADYVKTHYPQDNILLYFNDTLWEDEDLYRFIYEASDKLKLPLLIHSRGLTPPQLMVLQRFMANSRAGTCSQKLKMKVASDYLKKGKVPEIEKWHNRHYLKDLNFVEDAILYFGIGFNEIHREVPIRKNWKPFTVEMPLIEHVIDNDAILRKYELREPQLYLKGFAHNNCGGRCVKGGQGHFKNLYLQDNASFQVLMEQEIVISKYIRYTKQVKGNDYLFDEVWEYISTGKKTAKIQHIINTHKHTKNWNFGYRNHPYTFIKNLGLDELVEKHKLNLIDQFDIGGCGCFVEFGNNEQETEPLGA